MTDLAQVSFTKGEVSPVSAGRTDTSFYASALTTCENVIVRAEGAASNRAGLEFIADCVTNTSLGSFLIPFVYNNQQSYISEAAAGSWTMYANGALVQSGVVNPYALADLPALRWAQSADTLTVCVSTQPPMELKRTTPTTFTYSKATFLNGPFQDLNTDGTTTVYASGTQGNVTLTASKAIFSAGNVGGLIQLQEQFLAAVIPWEANKVIATGLRSPVGLYCRNDGKIYKCVDALPTSGTGDSAQTATGVFAPVHTSGTQADGNGGSIPNLAGVVGVSWQFVSTDQGSALITGYVSPTQVTATIQSDKGVYSNFPPTTVGPPGTLFGPFTFTGNGTSTTFSPLTAITTGDPNQFLVTVAGIFSDPMTYSIDKTGTAITFLTAPANGAAIVVKQVDGPLLNKDNTGAATIGMLGLPLTTYWALGSFSPTQGWPACVVYYNDRLVYAGTSLQPQTVFTSIVSNYKDFGTSSPVVDSDGITFTLNARQQNPIVDLIPLNDLLVGTPSTIWRVTHSAAVGAITPNDISLLPQNFYGQQPIPSVQTGDTVIYAQWGGHKVRDLQYQFQYDKFVGTELTVFARHLFETEEVTRMAFAPEPYGLLFGVRSDGVLCVCTYLPEQQVVAWSRWITDGLFEDVTVIPENGGFSVYVIVNRTLSGVVTRSIERFKPRDVAEAEDYFFVDCGSTYDGRNTSSTTMTFIQTPLTAAISNVGASVGLATITTATAHGLQVGQGAVIAGVIGTGSFNVNGNVVVETVLDALRFTVAIGGIPSGHYVSGGTVTSTTVLQSNEGTLIASSASGWAGFQASDVAANNAIWLYDAEGDRLTRLQIVAVASSLAATALVLDPVQNDVLGVALKTWRFAKSNLTGLAQLANQAVAIQADGAVQTSQTVSNTGTLTLESPGAVVHAGLPFTSILTSMNFNIQNQETIRGRTKNCNEISVVVDRSAQFKAGTELDKLRAAPLRKFENYGTPTMLHTGIVHVIIRSGTHDDLTVSVVQDQPAPLTVISWVADVEVGEVG